MRLAACTYEVMAGKNIEGAIAAVAGVLGYQGLRPQQEQALHVFVLVARYQPVKPWQASTLYYIEKHKLSCCVVDDASQSLTHCHMPHSSP